MAEKNIIFHFNDEIKLMSSTRRPPKTAREEETQSPSLEQIAILYGLSNETRQMAREANTVLNSFIFTCLHMPSYELKWVMGYIAAIAGVLSYYMGLPLKKRQYGNYEYSDPTIVSFGVASIGLYFMWYKLWQLSCTLSLKKFPNGIGFDKQDRTFRALQRKIRSKDDAEELIAALRKLIPKQRTRKNHGIMMGLAACTILIMSLSTAYKEFGAVDLASNRFGIFIGPGMNFEKVTPFEIFLIHVISTMQQFMIYQPLYSAWSNYNTPKQLENYRKRLRKLSDFNHEWQLLTESSKKHSTKNNALFKLNLSENGYIDSGLIRLSTSQFMVELHRILLEENIPVFMSDNQLYVGYCEINEKSMKRIKRNLETNLLAASHYENQSKQIIAKLNTISSFLKEKTTWDVYRALTSDGQLEEYYYCDLTSLRKTFRGPFCEALSNIAAKVDVDENIVRLDHVSDMPENYSSAKTNFKSAVDAIQLQSDRIHQITPADAPKTKTKNKSKDEPVLDEKTPTNNALEMYPESVSFSHGVQFSRNQLENPTQYNEDFTHAWPLHVPYLPEGRAYLSVEPAMAEEVKPYLTTTRILSRLQVGTVHGASKSDHSKVGTVGIQTTDEAYQTVHGEHIEAATFRQKDGNIRMFAHRVETVVNENGKKYDHYRLDGWRFGH